MNELAGTTAALQKKDPGSLAWSAVLTTGGEPRTGDAAVREVDGIGGATTSGGPDGFGGAAGQSLASVA